MVDELNIRATDPTLITCLSKNPLIFIEPFHELVTLAPLLPSLVESHAENKSVAISSPAAYLYGTGSTLPTGLFWGGSQLLCCSQYTRFDKFSFTREEEVPFDWGNEIF